MSTGVSSALPPRILIVDDEAAQVQALCDILGQQGYEAKGFSSGARALCELENSRFDLLLTDLTMPEMDGIDLLKAARQSDPDLVGIIMTGAGTIASAVEAMKSGALDYILKPFKLSAVLPVLSRALAMRRLRMENLQLQQDLRAHAAELEAANKDLEAFSYSVSHDLRAPLRAITGFCRIVEDEIGPVLNEQQKRYFDRIIENGKKMGTLIDDLLAFSKLGREPVRTRTVDMTALVAGAWTEAKAACSQDLARFSPLPLPTARADPTLLRQVWLNLLSNALKYSGKRDEPAVEVGGRIDGTEAVYWVKDNGVGFDMRYAEKLFTVFQRLHRESDFPGTGVGLAIVQRVITRHGGRVWAESKPNEGATFYFALPT